MAKKLQIVMGKDNPILRAVSVPVKNFDSSLKKFVKGMREAMIGANGLGIAAPQVGKNIRVFIVTLNVKTAKAAMITMVNPMITHFSDELEIAEEGCLSLPGEYGKVERPHGVTVEFFDVEGARQVLSLDGLNARVVQHEMDHLDGVLFIDKLAG